MAILHMDGFDGYSSVADLALTYSGAAQNFSTSAGRYGGGAWQFGQIGTLIVPGPFPLETWMGFAYQMNEATSSEMVIATWNSVSDTEATLTYNATTGQMKAYRGNRNYLVASATVNVNDNAWHWWDIHHKQDVSGAFEIWIDGTRVLNFSGDMSYNAVSSLASITIGSVAVYTPRGYMDDLVIVDTTGSANNGRVSDSRIESLRPSSDASPNNGTPSTGATHYGVVDDTTWDASDYTTITNTSGQEELFGISDLASTPSSVAAVKVTFYAQKTDTGSAILKTVVVSSGTEGDGPSQTLGTAWGRFGTIYEQDPHTTAPWIASAVNALQAGVKVP